MKKYLGVVKVKTESFTGLNIRILAKFSDNKLYIEEWFKLYPTGERFIIKNNEILEEIFKDFEDFTHNRR